MATIKKRTWTNAKGEQQEAWQLRYIDQHGKERARQFARKGDASAYLTKVGWEVSQGTHSPDSTSITVSKAADLWIASARANGRERSTIKQYEELARLHVVPLIGDRKLSQLTMPMVKLFKDSLLETRSRAMSAKALSALTSILTDAQSRGLVAQNVAKGVRIVRSKRDSKKVTIPSKSDVRTMLAGARAMTDKPALHVMIMLTALAGLRSSELRGLRKADVDLKAGIVHIAQRADQWGVIGAPKSEAGSRSIPIPPLVVSELRKWILRAPVGELGLLFPNSDGGTRLHSNLLNREYWPMQVNAGLTRSSGKQDDNGEEILRARYDFHALRHYAASAWIKQKVDLKRLTTWLGHSSVQITLDTYGHLIKDDLGDAAIVAAIAAELLA